jgi:hypothetical protein
MNTSALSGRYSNSVGGGWPGIAAREIARVVLDALAVAQFANHLDVVARALLQALRLEKLVASLSWATRSSSSTSI